MFVGDVWLELFTAPLLGLTTQEVKTEGETSPPTVLMSEQQHSVAVKLRLSLTVA